VAQYVAHFGFGAHGKPLAAWNAFNVSEATPPAKSPSSPILGSGIVVTRALDFICVMASEHLGEGVITGLGQLPAETLGESCGLGVIEPAKDTMANQATGAQQRRINLAG
jgi:hypothetical protein